MSVRSLCRQSIPDRRMAPNQQGWKLASLPLVVHDLHVSIWLTLALAIRTEHDWNQVYVLCCPWWSILPLGGAVLFISGSLLCRPSCPGTCCVEQVASVSDF